MGAFIQVIHRFNIYQKMDFHSPQIARVADKLTENLGVL